MDARVRRGAFTLRLAFELAEGETLAVLGPNGAGKSTLVLALAGLLRLDQGRVQLAGRLLEDAERGDCHPPQRRGIGVVFQSHRLFPQLSVRQNLGYGLRARRLPTEARRAIEEAWLERLDLSAIADTRADRLSTGQAQRVALARAMAIQPDLLLLDEPFAALDAEARPAAIALLADVLTGPAAPRCALLVTHEVEVARALTDHWLILEAGRVTGRGTAEAIAAAPASDYARSLLRDRDEARPRAARDC